jgi:NTE family protein
MKRSARESLDRVPLFAGLDTAAREALAGRLVHARLERGETLFREGDPGAALYLIESGEVRVLTREGTHEVCRLGPGEHVGEMSLVDPAPRSAAIVARCDTTLWKLDRSDFDALCVSSPDLYRHVAVTLARRLRDTTGGDTTHHTEPVILIVDARDATDRADDLFNQLIAAVRATTGEPIGVIHLGLDATGAAAAGSTSICITDPENVSPQVDSLLDEHSHVLLLADTVPADARLWRAALGRADLLLVVFTITASSLARARQVLDQLAGLSLPESPPVELAVDRRAESARVAFRPVDDLAAGRVVHTIARTPGYAAAGAPDFAGVGRLARRIARRQVGLALGGGGARAFAHIGVLSVFERAGIPIDVLAGTSAGAIVAGLAARDWDSAQIAKFLLSRWTRRGVIDWGLIPWVSLLRGRKLERIGRDAGEGLTLEELTRPFVAVATDLVTGGEVRLRRGDGWTAVRASLTVPGVFPPVRLGDRYLVDGGAINNLPADAAREAGADIVIGVNVSPPLEPAFLPAAPEQQSRGFFDRLRTWRLSGGLPLFRIIYRTITVQGQALHSRQGTPDVTLMPDVAKYDMFEFGDLRPIIERGRAAAEARLDDVKKVVS